MKALLPFFLTALLMSVAFAATPSELTPAEKLRYEGNHREAADALVKLLDSSSLAPKTAAQALTWAVESLTNLDEEDEAVALIEKLAARPNQNWLVLSAAGEALRTVSAYGHMDAGKFTRSNDGTGQRANAAKRDAVRTLQLLLAARELMPADADPEDRGDLLFNLVVSWLQDAGGRPGGAWKLMLLTDVKTLPEIDTTDDDEDEGGDASGFPTQADGTPLVFGLPADFASAKNDGERLRLAIAEWGKIGPANEAASRVMWASLVRQWLGVSHAAGFLGNDEPDREKMQRDSLAAVHTLSEDETVALLATGPKRITLPPAYRFLTALKDIPEPSGTVYTGGQGGFSGKWWRGYREERLGELMQRRQYEQAAAELRAMLAAEKDIDEMKSLTERISQIEGPWGRFEQQDASPAGTEAKLPLVFRNATQADFTAVKIDVGKLVNAIHAAGKANAEEAGFNWQFPDLGQWLIQKGTDGFAIGESATWSAKLKPAPHHWDTRLDLQTPLKDAGAYLIEAQFNGQHPTRMLLWVEGVTMVSSIVGDQSHVFVCDAVTGEALPKAKVDYFGFLVEYNTRGRRFHFTSFSEMTNAVGVTKFSNRRREGYRWVALVTTEDGRVAFSNQIQQGYSRRETHEGDRFFSITDRPVYRPGQEVKWQFMARRTGYKPKLDTNPFAGERCDVVIYNPRNEKVLEKEFRFDDWGTIGDALKLSDDAALGHYRAMISQGRNRGLGSFHFSVEEYKKPEFEVKIEAPEKPVALGESFEFKVKADYYFGGAVKQAKVKYSVRRSAHQNRWLPIYRWDWLYGSGYGWQTLSYEWYPNSALWCRCMAPWYSWRNDPPETITEGESAIGEDGTVKIKVDTAAARDIHGDEDHEYEIEVHVTDQSRRTIDGKGKVIAARRPFEVSAWLNQGYYRVGDKGVLHFGARTLDGSPVNASGTARVLKVTYDEAGRPTEKEVKQSALKTEVPTTELVWAEAGQFRVEVKMKDAGGRESITSVFVTVRGEGFDGRGYRFDDLELLVEKEEYQPGEEVELLINTNRENSTVALFVYGSQAEPVFLKLEGKSLSYKFALRPEDQPNLNVYAYTVSNARLHEARKKIIIPPNKRIASVELTTDQATYKPRDKAKAKLLVKDQHGQPFVGKVVLTAYDKALEYISASNVGDIRKVFWGWVNHASASATSSLQDSQVLMPKDGEETMTRLSDTDRFAPGFAAAFGAGGGFGDSPMAAKSPVMPPPPASPGARGMLRMSGTNTYTGAAVITPDTLDGLLAAPSESGGSAPVMIRSNLADSALWITSVTTNEAGEAEIDFDMPDNLTTWKLRGWVLGKEAQVGEAGVEIITRKNLMVRLQAPRFFVEKDEVVISANIHNETDAALMVRPELEVDQPLLVAMSDKPQPLSIPAHGEQRVDWRMKVSGSGEVKLTAKAMSETESDAMQMTFPVYEHGTLKTDSWSLAVRGEQTAGKIDFTVPAERKPETTRLEIRWSPTLAMACIDALPYLVDYPYGCTEQTLNRFLPTVLTQKVLRDLGLDLKAIREKRVNLNAQQIDGGKRHGDKDAVFDEQKVASMVRTGLNKLDSMQNRDGGWGWFPGGRESSAHITALVAHGLLVAEAREPMLQEALEWLTRHENEEHRRLQLHPGHEDHKSAPGNTDALVHSVLVEARLGLKEMRDRLYQERNGLSSLNLALLGLAHHATGENEARDMCLRNLRQFLKQDEENQTAWLDLPNGSWWYWWGDEMETQAAFLKLLSATEPKGDLASRIAKHLLNNRRNGTYWNSTRDTAAVIEALSVFAKASGETKPNMEVEIKLDGQVKKSVQITAETLFAFDNSLVLQGADIASGKHTLEISRKGSGPLYANAYLTLFSKEDNIPAAGLEVKVERRYYKITEEKKTSHVADAKGTAVAQQGRKTTRTELKSGDPLKSGDEVEVELVLESKNDYEYVLLADPKPAGFEAVEVNSGWVWEGLSAYREFRDEKVAFFVDRLPQGRHTIRYRVRAEVPGKFSALPAKAEAMYAPELRGNAAEWKAVIADGE
jgi:alpha-2-macroglobulin